MARLANSHNTHPPPRHVENSVFNQNARCPYGVFNVFVSPQLNRLLYYRNTRRYGGYIVHFGVAVVIIGILGTPFNRDAEKKMGFGDKMNIGSYTLVCQSYTQDDNANYSNEWAIINVFKGRPPCTGAAALQGEFAVADDSPDLPDVQAGSFPRQ